MPCVTSSGQLCSTTATVPGTVPTLAAAYLWSVQGAIIYKSFPGLLVLPRGTQKRHEALTRKVLLES